MNEPVTFSVNCYDRDGDIFDEGIFLHFGDTAIKAARTLSELDALGKRISGMCDEIRENYNVPD